VEVALLDGAYHQQDSSDLAFRLCARACFLEGAARAAPRLLEPLMRVDVTIAEDRVGDVVGDLVRRRGIVSSVNAGVVHAEVPLAELFGYAGDLRSRTQGRGTFTMSFLRYA
jgi:elongation factor G